MKNLQLRYLKKIIVLGDTWSNQLGNSTALQFSIDGGKTWKDIPTEHEYVELTELKK